MLWRLLESEGRSLEEANQWYFDTVVTLYTELSGDAINQATFWSDFKRAAKLRNRMVHTSYVPTPEETVDSLAAYHPFIEHLKSKGL